MRPLVDLSVYLVTDTDQCGGPDGLVATVAEAVRAGVSLVQFRDHHLDDDEFVALGTRLVAAIAGTDVPLLIDDRVHLVEAIGAHGAHIGQNDLAADQARTILGPGAILGLTATSAAEARAAAAAGLDVDYLGASALRATGTKPESAGIGFDEVAAICAASPVPVCAIGGVKAADAEPLARIGCAGMSVVSAICGQPDVTAATVELADAWRAAAPIEVAR